MVVGVVDQDVEHHAAKQLRHVALIVATRGLARPAQQLGEVGVAQIRLLPLRDQGAQSHARRDAVNALLGLPVGAAVEAPHCDGVLTDKRHDPGLRRSDPCLRGKGHRGVFDERHVDGLVVEKLDDPRLTVDVDQRLGLRAAKAAAGRKHPPLDLAHGLFGVDFFDHLGQQVRAFQLRQWAVSPWQVFGLRHGNTQRTKSVVTRKVQVFHQRQATWLVQMLNHTLAPAVGPCIVDRAGGNPLAAWQVFHVDQGQVFTQRETVLQPSGRVAERDPLARAHEVQLTHHAWCCGLSEEPQVELVEPGPGHVRQPWRRGASSAPVRRLWLAPCRG